MEHPFDEILVHEQYQPKTGGQAGRKQPSNVSERVNDKDATLFLRGEIAHQGFYNDFPDDFDDTDLN
eukprot:gene1104-4332_t